LVSHGRKVNSFGLPRAEVFSLIVNSRLLPLCNMCYEVADKGLLRGFVERWHRDTNTFHMPFGEMTITLDDVSSLLYLPIMGQFSMFDRLDNSGALDVMLELLGVPHDPANAALRDGRGNAVLLSWLRDHYATFCENENWEIAARAYLLHLIGCTIFLDKSATSVSISYLSLFRDLALCGSYAWGAAALAHMYDKLGDASFVGTKQLGVFITLLQVHILLALN